MAAAGGYGGMASGMMGMGGMGGGYGMGGGFLCQTFSCVAASLQLMSQQVTLPDAKSLWSLHTWQNMSG
jgi:hypothetical protein